MTFEEAKSIIERHNKCLRSIISTSSLCDDRISCKGCEFNVSAKELKHAARSLVKVFNTKEDDEEK